MKAVSYGAWMLAGACLFAASPAMADSNRGGWKGHHHGSHRQEYRQVFHDGHCKVERQYRRNGSYRETRSCGPRQAHPYRGAWAPHAGARHAPVYGAMPQPGYRVMPQPIYRAVPQPVYPVATAPRPGVWVQPPTVVIQPPTIRIR